jgi:hypothetical protein
VIIAVAVFAYWQARNPPTTAPGGRVPGTLPKGLAVLLAGLGVLLVLHSLKSERMSRWSVRGPLFVLGGLVLFGLAVRPLGLAVAGPLAIAAAALASSSALARRLIYGC